MRRNTASTPFTITLLYIAQFAEDIAKFTDRSMERRPVGVGFVVQDVLGMVPLRAFAPGTFHHLRFPGLRGTRSSYLRAEVVGAMGQPQFRGGACPATRGVHRQEDEVSKAEEVREEVAHSLGTRSQLNRSLAATSRQTSRQEGGLRHAHVTSVSVTWADKDRSAADGKGVLFYFSSC